MSVRNDGLFLERHRAIIPLAGPAIDVGSRLVSPKGVNLRELFPARDWTGIDMEPGLFVDIVHDMERPLVPADIDADFVTCMSMLEHCRRPWLAAPNIEMLVRPGGLLYVSIPFLWRFHRHPDDYWRMTPSALPVLFPTIEWIEMLFSTSIPYEFLPVPKVPKRMCRTGDGDPRKMMPVLTLHAIGRKP